jgi:hypothetical protein
MAFGADLLVRAILQYFGFLADLSQWVNLAECPLITLDRFWQASKSGIIWKQLRVCIWRPGRLPSRSNCKGPLGLPCAVTPYGTRPPV